MTLVRVPVRLRLEVAADRLDDLGPPVADAVRSAMDRVVLQAAGMPAVAGTGRAATGWCVEVSWTGDRLPATAAHQVERVVRGCLDEAAARLTATPAPGAAARERPGPTQETLDPLRLVVDGDGDAGYLVPFFDQFGVSMRLPRTGTVAGPGVVRQPRPRVRWRLRELTREQAVAAAAVELDRRALSRAVVFYLDVDASAVTLLFVAGEGPAGEPGVISASTINIFGDPSRGEAVYLRPSVIGADLWEDLGQAATGEEQDRMRRRLAAEGLIALGHSRTEQDFGALVEGWLAGVPRFTGDVMYAHRLTAAGHLVWIGWGGDPSPPGDWPAVVLAEVVEVQPEDEGYGTNCPPLDQAESASWRSAFGLLHPDPKAPDPAFLGEPAIWLLGTHGGEVVALMQSVAAQLRMPLGNHAGGFLIEAMVRIDQTCRQLRPDAGHTLDAELERMGHCFADLRLLVDRYLDVILLLDLQQALPCPLQRRAHDWRRAFLGTYWAAQNAAIASMFVTTCQGALHRALLDSHAELVKRQQHQTAYLALTRDLLLIMFSDTADLVRLREAIGRQRRDDVVMITTPAFAPQTWRLVSESVLDLLHPSDASPAPPQEGTVETTREGYRVYDGKGRWWTLPELDAVIAAQRTELTTIDPLMDKVTEVAELTETLRAAWVLDTHGVPNVGAQLTSSVDRFFTDLLTDLVAGNEERTQRAARDRGLALGLAAFSRDDDVTNPVGAHLSGIHDVAYRRLTEIVTDRDALDAGVGQLAFEEISKAELWEFVNLVGPIVLTIFCPPLAPLAAAWNIAVAVEGLSTAMEHRDVQRALLDGDEILSRAQVEAEMWAATIGVVLAVVPEIPGAARAAVGASGALIKGEGKVAAKAALRRAMERATEAMVAMTIERFAARFTAELAKNYVIKLALDAAMQRIAQEVAREASVQGSVSAGDVLNVFAGALSQEDMS